MTRRPTAHGEITLRKLQAFAAVAEAGSLTTAARKLGVAQPTLSQLIAGLEGQSGAQLFLREGSGMVLSDAGELLLRKAENVLNEFEEFGATLDLLNFGRPVTLKIAALPSVMRMLVPQAAAELRADFPALNIDGHEHSPNKIIDLLYRRSVHLGILGAYSVPELSSAFARIEILADPIVVVSPKGASEDLPFLHVELGSHASQRMALWFETRFPKARSIMNLRSYETAVRFAQAGLGRCVVPLLSYEDARADVKMDVRLAEDLPKRRLEAIIPQTHLRVPAYSQFIEKITKCGLDRLDMKRQKLTSL